MKYVSMIHALNVPCKLNTMGDWHRYAIQWENPHLLESKDSVWGDYGIEKNKIIPYHKEKYNVANHIRALLDLIYFRNFSVAQGMNKDFIGNSEYDAEIFNKVIMLKNELFWQQIDQFMSKEYRLKWIDFKRECNYV